MLIESGLTPVESTVVKPPRVAESVFSIEAKLLNTQTFNSTLSDQVSGVMVVVQGLYFHVREDGRLKSI